MTELATETMMTDSEEFAAMRHAMVVSQLRTSAVSDSRVVEAMGEIPREHFLPESVHAMAYLDTLLPLGGGRDQNSPLATGRLLTVAQVRSDDRVLLIGSTGGYTAAVLARLATGVVALEEVPELVAAARANLANVEGVKVVQGPLTQGWAEDAPYTLVVIDGAVEHVPDAILAQMAPGARMVAGLVDRGITRLASGEKSEGGFALLPFADCECAVLPGFAVPKTFTF